MNTAAEGARVLGVATAVPEHCIDTPVLREVVLEAFEGLPERVLAKLMRAFDRSGVECRYSVLEPERLLDERSWAESNALYQQHALRLSARAIRGVLEKTGFDPRDVDALYSTSTTGLSTPSIESLLIPELGLSWSVDYSPSYARGCAGGAVALARATEYVRAYPDRVALVVAAEVSSLMFPGFRKPVDIISASLFADGAGAVLIAGPEAGYGAGAELELVASRSVTWPESRHIMGWDYLDERPALILDSGLPSFLTKNLETSFEAACDACGVSPADLEHYVLHPGGPAVIGAMEEALELAEGSLEDTREVLRRFGNMSSATVLFVLERFLWRGEHDGGPGVLGAMGPGFSAQFIFFRAPRIQSMVSERATIAHERT